MKRSILFLATVVLTIFMTPLLFSQEEKSDIYLLVNYMRSTPGMAAEYVDLEKTVWKPMHQERVNQGIINSWTLYRVYFSAGQEYNYVTVHFLDDFAKIDLDGYPESVIKNAHPDKTEEQIQELVDKTLDARKMVKTEVWQILESITSSDETKYLHVNYMTLPDGDLEDFFAMQSEIWKPIQEAKRDAGFLTTWMVGLLVYPAGTDRPYYLGTVDSFKEFADVREDKIPHDVYLTAHPDTTTWDALWERTRKYQDIVKKELWGVVAATSSPSEE